jgi:magnesium-transporting ATPase (P-type)
LYYSSRLSSPIPFAELKSFESSGNIMSASSLSTPQLKIRRQQPTSRWIWIAFFACALLAITLFFIPAFIIRPFRHQSPRALMLAMTLRQHAPLGTLIATLACLVLAYELWRTATRWRTSFLILAMLVVTFSAVMARLNYFEWMFHPIPGAQFLPQSQSKLDPKEMIMAVRFGSAARAYPISQMAYHHILNDEVDGVPIAVTY